MGGPKDTGGEPSWLPPLHETIPASLRVQAMAREPIDGVPDNWGDIDVARTPAECIPHLRLCSETECMESWLNDFFLRVLDRGTIVWVSPDAPHSPAPPFPQPSHHGVEGEGGVVIPFPRR